MFPDSPFATSRGSFNAAVPPPTNDPDADPTVSVCVSFDWVAYILGSLKQLLLQSTWATTDPNVLALTQERVFNLMSMFANAAVCVQSNPLIGGDCEGDCDSMCCLRVNNGVLQTLSCGVWTDVPGQAPGGLGGSGQPGPGSPQPAPGGGCQSYDAKLVGDSQWLAPTGVSSGDTITLSGFSGLSYDGTGLSWHCSDGSLFLLGLCTGSTSTGGGYPMPAVPTGKVIVKIGSTYYDAQPGPFTVPGGHSNDSLTVLFNLIAGANNGGQMSFQVTVCNNQLALWTHYFDFTTATRGFSPETILGGTRGAWTPGTGWTDTLQLQSDGVYVQGVYISLGGLSSFEILSSQLMIDWNGGIFAIAGEYGIAVFTGTGTPTNAQISLLHGACVSANGQTLIGSGDFTGQSYIQILSAVDVMPGSPAGFTGNTAVRGLLINGRGVEPVWP